MQIVISGGSTIAECLVPTMLENGHRVTIIEEDRETLGHLTEVISPQVLLVEGDGCDSEVLRDAGVQRADLFISLMGHDDTNFVACQLAKAECGVPRCISTLNSPKNESIFRKSGIEPVSSTALIARMVEEEAIMGDMKTVFYLREGDITMIKTTIPLSLKRKKQISVSDMHLPDGVKLIAVARNGDFEMITDDTVIFPGESIVAAVKADAEEKFRSVIRKLQEILNLLEINKLVTMPLQDVELLLSAPKQYVFYLGHSNSLQNLELLQNCIHKYLQACLRRNYRC